MDNITRVLTENNQPAYRIKQVLTWVWAKDVASYDEMTNVPKDVRELLASNAPLQRCTIAKRQISSDGSRKYLVQFADGVSVEVVGLPSKDRLTVCASSQAGCAMGCTFCATGAGGLTRSLTAAEIADSVRAVGRDFNVRVSNVVMMGQGEPFANYDAVLGALRIFNASWGLDIGARHITISTCGLISGIAHLATEPEQFTLAVSLHSAIQETRDLIMPKLSNQPLDILKNSLIAYYRKTGRRPSLEYALIEGTSDTDVEIAALGQYARGIGAHVNLIPLNEWDGCEQRPTDAKRSSEIATLLSKTYGIEATVRKRRGADIDAACGQLAQRENI